MTRLTHSSSGCQHFPHVAHRKLVCSPSATGWSRPLPRSGQGPTSMESVKRSLLSMLRSSLPGRAGVRAGGRPGPGPPALLRPADGGHARRVDADGRAAVRRDPHRGRVLRGRPGVQSSRSRLDLGFVDFRTREARLAACRREVELTGGWRRTCTSTYRTTAAATRLLAPSVRRSDRSGGRLAAPEESSWRGPPQEPKPSLRGRWLARRRLSANSAHRDHRLTHLARERRHRPPTALRGATP